MRLPYKIRIPVMNSIRANIIDPLDVFPELLPMTFKEVHLFDYIIIKSLGVYTAVKKKEIPFEMGMGNTWQEALLNYLEKKRL